VCIGGRTTPPSSYLFPEYGLGNRNTTINIVFLFFLFFVLRVTTKPSEEVDATLPTSLVSLARDPRLVLREILCWEDKNAYTEHVKGEDSLYFCGLVCSSHLDISVFLSQIWIHSSGGILVLSFRPPFRLIF